MTANTDASATNCGHVLNSSATDELRRMLDERGVEHYDGTETTLWGYEPTSESTGAYRFAADEISGGRMQVRMFNLTPEQAIAATLGETPTPPPPTPPKQPPYDELIESLRRDWDIEASWDGLRRFWYVGLTDEGVRKRDEREATLGRGTTTRHGKLRTKYGRSVPVCECCGYGIGDARWRFCPSCGAEVMEP